MTEEDVDARQAQSRRLSKASTAPSSSVSIFTGDILKTADPLSALRGRAAGKAIGNGIIGKRASEELYMYGRVHLYEIGKNIEIIFFIGLSHTGTAVYYGIKIVSH